MNKLIDEIKKSARLRNIPIMEDGPSILLDKILKSRQPQNILEIGTAVGYSGLVMLNASPTALLTTIEKNTDRMSEARQNFERAGVKERVRCIEDDANLVVSIMEGNYDFVLLDGPKSHYLTMIDYLLRLLTYNGMIFVDDILYHGYIEGNDYPLHKHRTIITAIRQFIAKIRQDKRLITKVIKAGDGVMLIEKRTSKNKIN